MKRFFTLFNFVLFILTASIAQPGYFQHNLNSGTYNGTTDVPLTDRGVVRAAVAQATGTATRAFLFPNASGNYSPKWAASGTSSIAKDARLSNGAVYNGANDLKIDVTDGNYYTVIVNENSGSSNDLAAIETSFNPAITWSSLTAAGTTASSFTTAYLNQGVVISSTTNRALDAGEKLVIRYSTNGFGASSFVTMSLSSGSTYIGTIPAQSAGATVNYYLFTTKSTITPTHADADYQSLVLNNNNGSNYSYTISNNYGATTDGSWSAPGTWANGSIPPASANIIIAADVVLDVSQTIGNITINSGKTLSEGFGNYALTLNSGSTFTNNGIFTRVQSKIIFAGTGTVAGSSVTNFHNVDISGGVNFGTSQLSGTLTIKAGGFVNTNRPTYNTGSILKYDVTGSYGIGNEWVTGTTNNPKNVEIASGTTLTFNAITTNRTLSDNLTIDGILTLSSSPGGDLVVGGWFTNNGTFNCNTRSVTFNSTGSVGLNGMSSSTFDYLVINSSSQILLYIDAVVTTALTFTSGHINLDNSNLTLNSGASVSASSTSFAITTGSGKFIRKSVGNTAKLFPVGYDFSFYSPVTITNSGTADDFGVKVGTTLSTPIIASKAVGLQWDISEGIAGGSNATLVLQWALGKEGGSFDRNTGLRLGHYNGSTWDLTTATLGGSDPYTATASGFTSFSPFAVMNDVALSAELLSFGAIIKGNNNLLTWVTSSEKDNAHFNIERSSNSLDFTTIATVKATNNPSGSKYNFTDDAPLSTINYYRLQMVSTDGKMDYSKVVSVSGKEGKQTLSVYPNPVKAELTILSDGNTEGVNIYDMTGKIVRQYNDNRSKVNVQDLPNGVYFVRLLDKNGLSGEAVRFVKQ